MSQWRLDVWGEMGRHQRLPRRLSKSDFYSNACQFVALGRYIQLYPVLPRFLLLVPFFLKFAGIRFFFLTLKEEGQEERQGQWSATCLESPF